MKYVFLNENRKLELRSGGEIPSQAFELSDEQYAALCRGDEITDADFVAWLENGNTPDESGPGLQTSEQIIAAKKAERQAIVDAIVVTVSSGKVFDGNEEAQSRISRAIQTAEIAGIESTTWVLANNVPTVVTLPELKEALVLSMQAMGAVWASPYEG